MIGLLGSISPVTHRGISEIRTHPLSRNPTSTLPNLPEEVEVSVGDYSIVVHHGGHLQNFWQVWENLHCHPRVVQILRWGYQILLQSNLPTSIYPIIQRQEKHGFLKIVCRKCFKNAQFTISGIVQLQVFTADCFLYQNREKMAPCDRSQCPGRLHAGSNFQNGNSRDYEKLSHKRQMASFNRPERCVLSHSHTSRFSTVTTFPCRQKNVSVQSTAI